MRIATYIVLSALIGVIVLAVARPAADAAPRAKSHASLRCADATTPAVDVEPAPIVSIAAGLEPVIARWPAAVVPHLAPGDIARTVARAVMEETCGGDEPKFTEGDGRERCVWTDGWNSDHAKAVLVASVAYYEGARFARYVDEGKCNEWMRAVYARRALPPEAYIEVGGKRADLLAFGNCDGGRAWSLWQIHPDDLTRPVLTGPDLRDRDLAASVALGMLRLSMRGRGDLCWYTGEDAAGGCPKARERLDFARKALHDAAPTVAD